MRRCSETHTLLTVIPYTCTYVYIQYLHIRIVGQYAHTLFDNLQQDEVIAELNEFARSDPRPDSAASVERVVLHLEALNKLFERGLLGNKVRVFTSDGSTIQRMSEGFRFFTQWKEELIRKGA